MAKILFYSLLIMISIPGFSQQPTLTVLINGKNAGKQTIGENAGFITVHRLKFQHVSSFAIVYKEVNASNVYKRSLEVTSLSDSILDHLEASKSKTGWFNLDIHFARKIVSKESKIKLYLIEDPANDRMALPSRRKLLAEIHFI